MAKFIVDLTDNPTSKSALEVLLENCFDYNVYVKEIKPFDEEKLEKLAEEVSPYCYGVSLDDSMLNMGFQQGFKAGYKKAIENQ